jgi:hypothetical protein
MIVRTMAHYGYEIVSGRAGESCQQRADGRPPCRLRAATSGRPGLAHTDAFWAAAMAADGWDPRAHFLADAGSCPGNCSGLEEATGAPSSLSNCDPKRPRASGRGGETVGRHRANLMPTALLWLPSSIYWQRNALQPFPAHDVSKTMKPVTLPITYLMTYRLYGSVNHCSTSVEAGRG